MDLKPKVTYKKASEHYKLKGQYDFWISYSRRITKNPFVKEYLFQRQKGICLYCHKPIKDIKKAHIHHIDYMNICIYPKNDYIEIPHPTPQRPNRTAKISKCEICFKENKEQFLKCISKLALVHSVCNKNISFKG
jgi:5-methylcytosine-specific restriction endonuclease McrA